jgi:hypothetical protein
MMNDNSVSECDICVTKENRGVDLNTSHDFHKKFNTFLTSLHVSIPLFVCTYVWPQHIQATLQ